MKKSIFFLYLVIVGLFSCDTGKSQTELSTRDLVTGLKTPWEILWGPDNYIWMTERYGRVSRVNPETGELQELLKIPEVLEDGERGLLGMALHPDFVTNVPEILPKPYVYLIYNYGTTGNSPLKIVRYKFTGTKLDSPLVIMKDIPGAWNHDGSRLWINPADYTLYVTMGDHAVSTDAQDLSKLNGKILRMNLDGTVPGNNPYPGSFIWSYGHRNPQGLVYAKGKLYSAEHGPDTDDEVNIIQKGRNYGWPNVKGYCDTPGETDFCNKNLVVEPIATWTPTIAPGGLDYYGRDLIPEWKNSLLLAVLKGSRLIQLKLNDKGDSIVSQNTFFLNQFGRLRDICISPVGKVYISTSNRDGRGSPKAQDDRIIEITPKTSNVTPKTSGEIIIYPNPGSGILNINGVNTDYSVMNFSVFNTFGELVKTQNSESANNSIIDITSEPSGTYFLKMSVDNLVKVFRVVKW